MIDSFLTLSASFFISKRLLDHEETMSYDEHESNELFNVLASFTAEIVSAYAALTN